MGFNSGFKVLIKICLAIVPQLIVHRRMDRTELVGLFPRFIQSDKEASVHLTITLQTSGAQRLFDHSVCQKRPNACMFDIQSLTFSLEYVYSL